LFNEEQDGDEGTKQKPKTCALNASQGNLATYEKGRRDVPLWILKKLKIYPEILVGLNKNFEIKNPFPLYSCSSLARIIANFCGDGSIDFERLKRSRRVPPTNRNEF